jgi:hypothetical protein
MLFRAAAAALLTASLVFTAGAGAAFAQDPRPPETPPAAGAPAPPPAAPDATVSPSPPKAEPHGVIVVAASDGANPAARALAIEVYRDAALRPPIDEAAARVLAGDKPGADAPTSLREVAELRATVARAESDVVSRRLLASIGTELGAPVVVTVALDAGRPVARVLRVTGAAFERVELGATIETASDGSKIYRWPGATATLRGLLGIAPEPVPEPLRPVAPHAPEAPAAPRPWYKSPWFWGTAGVVAAAGITVLVLSRTTGGPANVHLTGKVGK